MIPSKAAVIHAAHSGLSAAKDNGQNKAGESAAGRRSPRCSAALAPHSYLIGEFPPHYVCSPPGCTPLLGVGGLGGSSVGLGGVKVLANAVFRKTLEYRT